MSVRKERNVNSLLSIAVDNVMHNLPVYEKSSLDLLQILPPNIKNILLKKLTSTSHFSRNVKIINCLKAFVNSQTTHTNLTGLLVSDEILNILCTCKNLRRLDLTGDESNCKMTTRGLINLLQNTPNLENLRIQNCDKVNNDVLKCISTNCRKLLGLDIGGCVNVTDEGLQLLSDMKINWLKVSETQITDEGITALVKGNCGQTLEELFINNCIKITHIGLKQISLYCPNLTVFNFINVNTDDLTTDFLEFKQPPKQLFWQIPF